MCAYIGASLGMRLSLKCRVNQSINSALILALLNVEVCMYNVCVCVCVCVFVCVCVCSHDIHVYVCTYKQSYSIHGYVTLAGLNFTEAFFCTIFSIVLLHKLATVSENSSHLR